MSQSGFVSGDRVEYDGRKTCLQEQYAPKGVELEWQHKQHSARHAGETRAMLALSGGCDVGGQGLPFVVGGKTTACGSIIINSRPTY